MTTRFKNPSRPQPTSYGRDGVREGRFCFAFPTQLNSVLVFCRQLPVKHRDHTIQTEQAWRCSQHSSARPTSRRFQTEVRSHFLKRRLDVPATRESFDDLLG